MRGGVRDKKKEAKEELEGNPRFDYPYIHST